MSDEKTDKPEPKKIPQPSRLQWYRCPDCGIAYNTFDYECPRCVKEEALRADIMAKLDLVLAAGDMKGGEKKPAKKTGK